MTEPKNPRGGRVPARYAFTCPLGSCDLFIPSKANLARSAAISQVVAAWWQGGRTG